METQVHVSDTPLAHQVEQATPEQLVAMLLEGAQRFLQQLIEAMEARDLVAKARMVNRLSAIFEELERRLDREAGGELALNLARIYEWWSHELMEASASGEAARLRHIGTQMEGLRRSWLECGPAKSA